MRLARALLAFLSLPFVVGGVVPWWLVGWGPVGAWADVGIVLMAVGFAVVLWCVRDFYTIGRGTLAPWDPPRRLVIVGLYRFARNPMYVGVALWLLGWSLRSGSLSLLAYGACVGLGFHLRVVLYEEPSLKERFGDEWEAYRRQVRRWLPRLELP